MDWELKTAFVLGVLHSLEPGHGKTAMVAIMLDPKKRWFDSIAMAVSAVFSHSALILAIAFLAHVSGHMVFGSDLNHVLYDRIQVFGSVALIAIGLYLLMRSRKPQDACCHGDSHDHKGRKSVPILLGLGIGLFPCPSLIATFLASMSVGKFHLGLAAVSLFAFGSLLSLIVSAVILKWVGRTFAGRYVSESSRFPWARLQGAIILLVGLVALSH